MIKSISSTTAFFFVMVFVGICTLQLVVTVAFLVLSLLAGKQSQGNNKYVMLVYTEQVELESHEHPF